MLDEFIDENRQNCLSLRIDAEKVWYKSEFIHDWKHIAVWVEKGIFLTR